MLLYDFTNNNKMGVEWDERIDRFGRETDHLEDLGVDGWIILKLISKKQDGRARNVYTWLGIGTTGGL